MSQAGFLTSEERIQIEGLIQSFDNHGCGFGLDIKAQIALRRLLSALDEAEQAVLKYQAMIPQRSGVTE